MRDHGDSGFPTLALLLGPRCPGPSACCQRPLPGVRPSGWWEETAAETRQLLPQRGWMQAPAGSLFQNFLSAEVRRTPTVRRPGGRGLPVPEDQRGLGTLHLLKCVGEPDGGSCQASPVTHSGVLDSQRSCHDSPSMAAPLELCPSPSQGLCCLAPS